jgi:O-acetylserine/cysteine efflux transporter
VASYGLLVGVGQFGLMLYAMDGHITPGLASTIIQTQAFFTVALAVLANGERLGRSSLAGLAICGVGIAVIAGHTGGEVSLLGIALSLVAAMAWAIANIVAKRAGPINALALVAWSNLFAIGPLFAAALLFEGPDQVFGSISAASLGGWGTVLWQAFGNAVFGYGAWNWLLGRHAASRIAPLGLMVPVFGLGASAWYLAEPLPGWKLLAAALIVSGLALNLLPKRA